MKGDASISCSLNLIELRLNQLRFRKGRPLGEPREKMGLTADLRPNSNSQDDYKELRNALRGLCCNERRVIEILGRRNQAQRDRIAHGYKRVFGESLRSRLKSAIRGKALEKCLSLWMLEPAKRDAVLLHEALRGGPNKDRAVIGMFCTRTPGQIYQIKHAYYALFNQTLENHIDGSGFESPFEPQPKSKCAFWRSSCAFWRSSSEPKTKDQAPQRAFAITKLLLALVGGSRPGKATVDRHVAFTDAHPLSKVCTDKLVFSAGSSYGQLTATMNYYHAITTLLQHYGYDFEKPLSKKDTREFLQALRAVVQCLHQPSKFYAEELSTALSEAGSTDEETLIQIITTRAEVDMQCIKVEFKKECQRSLEEAIAEETQGNLRRFLLTVINQGDNDEPGLFSSQASCKGSTASNYSYIMSTRTPRQASDHSSHNYSSTSYFTSSTVSNNSQNSFQSSPWRLSSSGAYCKGALPKM